MVTMVDEIFDRHYQSARGQLNSALAGAFLRFGRAVGNAFRVLHRIEFSAPWEGKQKRI
jgi:hypothetical protein